MITKKLLFTFCVIFLPLIVAAETVEIDGISYELITKIKEARVDRKQNGYSGNIVIPSKVVYDGVDYEVAAIRSAAFKNSNIYSIVIPNSVRTIGSEAFSTCNNLTSVTMSNKLESVGKNAFVYSYRIASVHISDIEAWLNIDFETESSNPLFGQNSQGNGKNQFYINGQELTDLVIPSNITTIKKYAFQGCKSINSVTIPSNIKTIENKAFLGCTNLSSVHITDLNAWYNIKFGNISSNPLYNAHHLFLNEEIVNDFEVPQNIHYISDYLFAGCTDLQSINIPNSVTSIGVCSFSGCNMVELINIPNSVTSIGGSAFSGCNSLTSVTIPNSVCAIEDGLFSGCTMLESINIPNSVTTIGNSSFSACNSLTSVTIPNSVSSIGNQAFASCTKLCTIILGKGIKSIGTEHYLTPVSPGGNAFSWCTELKDVYCLAETYKGFSDGNNKKEKAK